MQYPTFSLEYELLKRYSYVSGADEVGRGCIAGPVFACIAIVSSEKHYIPAVRDSKLMSEKQRETLYSVLRTTLPAYAVGIATSQEIDRLNIRKATYLAMLRAYWKLTITPEIILMDGEKATIPLLGKTYQFNHGDARFYSIAAASIIAKVERDRYMTSLEEYYPEYGFSQHKGYGTVRHYEALKKLGPSYIHRKTFL